MPSCGGIFKADEVQHKKHIRRNYGRNCIDKTER